MAETELRRVAEQALALMRSQGFDAAQVSASRVRQHELNVAHNEPTLLRSTEVPKLALLGIVDGRKASTELADFGDTAVRERVASLFAEAAAAPQDDANAVSSDQRLALVQGPQQGDAALLADKLRELLGFRAAQTPTLLIEEAAASHVLVESHTLTSHGTDLDCSVGRYELGLVGTAREGRRSSSFNFAGGMADDLRTGSASEFFGIGEMMRDTARQVDTAPIGDRFVGDVVLMPQAVADLLSWLHGQISDVQLIAGSSLYRDKVGQPIASPLLGLRSRFDAPGIAAVSADAFVAPPVELLREGRLMTLTPSLYGSRKTGLPHVPVAAGGWELAAGATPRSELAAGIGRGAWVGRLSMGAPASNGDFSGVIKNSFAIADGRLGRALSETMISGNIAQMLRDVVAVSRERIDTGALRLPWLRVSNLHFS
jgi:PmbA protein